MGKATIVSNHGAGSYRIQPVYNTDRAVAEISRMQTENTAIDTRLTEFQSALTTALAAVYYAEEVLRAAITNEETEEEITEKQEALRTAEEFWQSLTGSRSWLELKKTANTKRIAWLQQETATPAEVTAWCADLTEDLTGTVGTIELGRENTPPIIRPGDSSAYSNSRDGQLQSLESSTAAAAFFNLAILPGAVKWKPRYRTGTASNIDTSGDTMTVTIDALTVDGIDCNQASVLDAVPVIYMTCNAVAFNNGDAVVVEFTGQNWDQPQVIGFVDNPQPCEVLFGFILEAMSDTESVERRMVVYDGAVPKLYETANFDMPCNWFDADTVLSWEGPYSRYYNLQLWDLRKAPACFNRADAIGTMEVNSNALHTLYDTYLYANGSSVASCPAGELVVGAAYSTFGSDKILLLASWKISNSTIHIYWWDETVPGWVEFSVSVPAAKAYQQGSVHFSASGRKCCWITKDSGTGLVGIVELTINNDKTTSYAVDETDFLDEFIPADPAATSTSSSDKEHLVVGGDYVGETLKKLVMKWERLTDYTRDEDTATPYTVLQDITETRKIYFGGKVYNLYNETTALFVKYATAAQTPENLIDYTADYSGSAARVLHLDLRFDHISLFESTNTSSYSLTDNGGPAESEVYDMGTMSMDVNVYDGAGTVIYTHDLGTYVPNQTTASTLEYPFNSSTNAINKDIAASTMHDINHTQTVLPTGEICLSAYYPEYTSNPGEFPSIFVDGHYYSYLEGGDIYALNGLTGTKQRFKPVRTTAGYPGTYISG